MSIRDVDEHHFFFLKSRPRSAAPIFRSMPAFVVGMPVAREIDRRAAVMPNARFHEKLRPGNLVLLLIVIWVCMVNHYMRPVSA